MHPAAISNDEPISTHPKIPNMDTMFRRLCIDQVCMVTSGIFIGLTAIALMLHALLEYKIQSAQDDCQNVTLRASNKSDTETQKTLDGNP